MSFGVGFIKLASCRADAAWLQEVFLMQSSAAWEGLGGGQRARSLNLAPSVGQRREWNSTHRGSGDKIDSYSLSEHWGRKSDVPQTERQLFSFPCVCYTQDCSPKGKDQNLGGGGIQRLNQTDLGSNPSGNPNNTGQTTSPFWASGFFLSFAKWKE